MHSVRLIQTAKWGYAIIAAILCAMGLTLLLLPGLPLPSIGVMVGMALGISGVVKLMGYLSRDLYLLAFQFDLTFGILLMALSVVVLLRSEHVLDALCLVLGIATLADGLLKIQTILTLRPSVDGRMLRILMGVALLADGVMGMGVALCAIKVLPPSLDRGER